MTGDVTALLVALGLLLGNAFFVGAEFAILSVRRSQVEPRAQAGSRAARTTLAGMERVSVMLACAQLGITMCSLGLGAVAEPALAHLLEGPFEAVGMPEDLLHPVAFAIALTVVVALHVVVGEMVPKNLAIASPERSALVLTPLLYGLAWLLSPVVRALNAIANAILRLVGVEPKEEVSSAFTFEEVASIVDTSRDEGLLDERHDLLSGALDLRGRVAGDVMVAWDALDTVRLGVSPAEVDRVVARTGFSRFPVVDDDGELAGYLHLKDLLYADDERYDEPVPAKRVRQLASVSQDEELDDALAVLRSSGSHLARVVEPGGRTQGVLFLEDVLEELVGEVRDATQRRGGRTVRPSTAQRDRSYPSAI